MMRRGFCLLLLASFLAGSAHAGYGFSRSLTIDKTKVPNTDQTDFPVLFCFNGAAAPCNNGSLAVANLKTVGNGGKVTNSSGFDIVFGSDSACTATLYKFEIERYIATTGESIFWVKIPTVATATNTIVYICYGNAAISTFQGDINGTWNSAYKRVYHFPNGTTLSYADSTVNAANGTAVNTPTPVAAQIGGGFKNDTAVSSGDNYVTASDTGLPSGTGSRTASIWAFQNTIAIWPQAYYWEWGTGANEQLFGLYPQTALLVLLVGFNDDISYVSSLSQNTWYYWVGTYNSADNVGRLYLNGTQVASATKASWNTVLNGTLYIGASNHAFQTAVCATCTFDEYRISNVVRSADWIATEYNNQSAPQTFYTIGAEVPLGGAKLLLMGVG